MIFVGEDPIIKGPFVAVDVAVALLPPGRPVARLFSLINNSIVELWTVV